MESKIKSRARRIKKVSLNDDNKSNVIEIEKKSTRPQSPSFISSDSNNVSTLINKTAIGDTIDNIKYKTNIISDKSDRPPSPSFGPPPEEDIQDVSNISETKKDENISLSDLDIPEENNMNITKDKLLLAASESSPTSYTKNELNTENPLTEQDIDSDDEFNAENNNNVKTIDFNNLINLYYKSILSEVVSKSNSENENENENIYHELEVRFGTRYVKTIDKMDYENVIKYLRNFGFKTADESGVYSLRIQNEFVSRNTGIYKLSENIRTEIYGLNAIQTYCNTNDLKYIITNMNKSVKIINKHFVIDEKNNKIPNVIMEDLNLILSYKIEEPVSNSIKTYMIENWTQFKKHFRYMNRVTFKHPDFPILVDLSIVRSSKRENGKFGKYELTYSTKESGIFDKDTLETYEIELEIDSSKIGPNTNIDNVNKLIDNIKKCIKYVLCGLQNTNYPVSYTELNYIKDSYGMLLYGPKFNKRLNTSNFIGPSSYTLQINNIGPININSNQANIRQDFVVTEKADGERHLLYVGNGIYSGKIYLINTSMNVIFTGAKTNNKEIFDTLIDGELILYDKYGKWFNMFAAFDIYYMNGKDIRSFPFIDILKNAEEISLKKMKTRYNILKWVVENLNLVSIVENKKIELCPIKLNCKKFYSNLQENKNHSIYEDITYNNDSNQYTSKENQNELDVNNTDIFLACGKILQYEKDGLYPYNIDGLILTHTKYGVGSDKENEAGPLKKITWGYSFKWKPPQYNTIDFLVQTVKAPNGEDIVKIKYEDGSNINQYEDLLQYKTVILKSTYIEKIHGYINPCQMIYDDKIPEYNSNLNEEKERSQEVLQFYGIDPYDPEAGIANIPMKKDNNGVMQMYTLEGQLIEDLSIIEFSYDLTKERGWGWIPLRRRFDKGENAYHVAQSNWKSIHNPITEEMITSGLNIPNMNEIDVDVYYKNNRQQTYLTTHLKIFHNYIKKELIETVCKKNNILIDFACGKAGDLSKWINAKIGFVFGIDLSKDNLENPLDGACARYLNARKKFKIVPDCLFVHGNSSLNIKSGESMLSEKSKQITNAVFGIGEKNENKLGYGVYKNFGKAEKGFDIASMQFALHYMFSNENSLQQFLVNLSQCVKVGGYFIATFYDGKSVFNMLRNKKNGEMISLFEDNKKIWSITKMYDDNILMLPNTIESLGLRIDVFQESINQTIMEYLVNFDYLTQVMERFGFVLPDNFDLNRNKLINGTGMFEEIFNTTIENKRKMFNDFNIIKNLNEMTESEKKISFLNRYCIFKKIRNVETDKIKISNINFNYVEKINPELNSIVFLNQEKSINPESKPTIEPESQEKERYNDIVLPDKSKVITNTPKDTLKEKKTNIQTSEKPKRGRPKKVIL